MTTGQTDRHTDNTDTLYRPRRLAASGVRSWCYWRKVEITSGSCCVRYDR